MKKLAGRNPETALHADPPRSVGGLAAGDRAAGVCDQPAGGGPLPETPLGGAGESTTPSGHPCQHLRVDAHLHRRLPADSELCQAIAVLARAHQDAIWRRTTAHHQLRSLLREFYPNFLAAFTGRFALGIASPEARAVLAIAPTPAAAAKLSVSPDRRRAAPSRP